MTEKSICFDLEPADETTFTGTVHRAVIAMGTAEAPSQIYYVRFEPGARTHWHTHTGTQMLLVQEGRCLVQREGRAVEEYDAGQAIRIAPGERHWHGADDTGVMAHVAINLDNEKTNWQEAVARD